MSDSNQALPETRGTTIIAAPLIEVEGLWTQFGTHTVHRDLNLKIFTDEIISIVGGSGTGKTTLVRQILALERPAKGTIKIFGQPLYAKDGVGLRTLQQRCGVLFQEGALFSALSVYENVAIRLRELKCFDESLIRDAVMLKLAMVGISAHHASKMPADLSGGMVKRVALARALALEPDILFLDEPTAGLDPDRSDAFVALIKELHRELNLTVVMITHDLDTLFDLSTRIVVLADQHIIADGPIAQVLAVEHAFITSYFHGPRAQRAVQVLPDHERLPKRGWRVVKANDPSRWR
jgi:phospholipid/cholesterol/gamma-HCH transport system ATP-binding protein